MEYTTNALIEQIHLSETRRQKAVFLAGRIKKASLSPGFDWDKAIMGFCVQFRKEISLVRRDIKERYAEHPIMPIDFERLIKHFSNQPYKKEST